MKFSKKINVIKNEGDEDQEPNTWNWEKNFTTSSTTAASLSAVLWLVEADLLSSIFFVLRKKQFHEV